MGRKKHSTELRARIALDAIKGQKTMPELSSEYGVHANQIIESLAPKPNTSRPRREHKVYPYLLRKLSITEPDQVWCSDIT